MHIFWGGMMILIGAWIAVCSLTRSDSRVYRLMVARAQLLWGNNVYSFLLVAGVLVILFGGLLALGVVSWHRK